MLQRFLLLVLFLIPCSLSAFNRPEGSEPIWIPEADSLPLLSRWSACTNDELAQKARVFEKMDESDSALLYYGVLTRRLKSVLVPWNRKDTVSARMYVASLNAMGILYMREYHNIQAFQCFLEALDYTPYVSEMHRMAVMNNMALVYMEYGDDEKAYSMLAEIYGQACCQDKFQLAGHAFVNILNSVLLLRDSIRVAHWIEVVPDSILCYQDVRFMLAVGRSFLARVAGNWEQAVADMKSVWEDLPLIVDSVSAYSAAWLYLGQAYMAGRKWVEAEDCLKQSSFYARQRGDRDRLRENSRLLAAIYQKQGRSERYMVAMQEYVALLDSTLQNTQYARIKELEYNAYKNRQDLKVSELEHRQSLHEEVIRNQKKVIAGVSVFSAVILLLLLLVWHQKKDLGGKNALLFEKNRALMAYEEENQRQKEVLQRQIRNLQERLASKEGQRVSGEEYPMASDSESGHAHEALLHADKSEPHLFDRGASLTDKMKKLKDEELQDQIRSKMEDGVFLDPDFSLEKLAKALKSNTSYVSSAINEGFGQNFASLVNDYRVKHACRIMNDPASYSYTLDYIASTCGFRNRNTFTQNFKRYTGLLPSQYIKMVKAGSEN